MMGIGLKVNLFLKRRQRGLDDIEIYLSYGDVSKGVILMNCVWVEG